MKHEITSMNTKKALANSLRKAMEKKTFSKITVSELIADCGVNRKTFYYHFQDIYSLLKWMLEQDAIEVVKKFDLIVDYEEALMFIMNYVENNNHIINCAYDSIGHDHVKSFFYSDFIELVYELITSAENKMGLKLENEYKSFLCKYFTEALSGMLMDWIKNRETLDKAKVISYITLTIKTSLKQIIRTQGESFQADSHSNKI